MEWSTEKCLELIDQYEQFPELWNPHHGSYFNKNRKYDAWKKIAHALSCSLIEAKRKMESLLSSFRREKLKIKANIGQKKEYHSKWFAFKKMEFLLDKHELQKNTISPKKCDQEDDEPADEEPEDFCQEIPEPQIQKYTEQIKVVKRVNNSVLENVNPEAPPPIFQTLQQDSCDVYGLYVAHRLRDYDKRTRAIVQHKINNIFFQADMGTFDSGSFCYKRETSPSPSASPIYSNE